MKDNTVCSITGMGDVSYFPIFLLQLSLYWEIFIQKDPELMRPARPSHIPSVASVVGGFVLHTGTRQGKNQATPTSL